jgi:hypothetical protein
MSVAEDKTTTTPKEIARLKGHAFVAKVKELIHEGNVRRITIKNDEGHTVLEIPVTASVIAVVAAPVIAAIGAIAALANEWTIEVEHIDPGT